MDMIPLTILKKRIFYDIFVKTTDSLYSSQDLLCFSVIKKIGEEKVQLFINLKETERIQFYSFILRLIH